MDYLKTVTELVNIESFSNENNQNIINYLIEKFKPYSTEILKVKNPDSNKYNLLIGLNTKINNTNAIILSGHIDTVCADVKAYNTPPNQATLINNKLFGLGVIDMKCYFATIIDNLKTISKLKKPIIVAITCDEETNLLGVEEIIKTLKQNNVYPHNNNCWRTNKFNFVFG